MRHNVDSVIHQNLLTADAGSDTALLRLFHRALRILSSFWSRLLATILFCSSLFNTGVSVPESRYIFFRDLLHWSLFPPTIPSSQYTAYRSDPAHPETVCIFLRSPLRMHTGENRSDCPVLSHQHESVVLNLHKHHFSFYLFYLRAWKCWEIKDLYLKLCTF